MDKISFGPPLYKTKVDENLRKELLEFGKKQTTKYNQYLAGKISNEFGFDDSIKTHFEKKIIPYIEDYFNIIMNENKTIDIHYKIVLDTLWINFQKNGEFNPPHDHNGHISFVIYLNIPEEIKEEKQTTQSNINGSITFIMGTNTNIQTRFTPTFDKKVNHLLSPKMSYNTLPETGDFYIFPSYLLHYVESFDSENVERISVSGNFILLEKNKGVI